MFSFNIYHVMELLLPPEKRSLSVKDFIYSGLQPLRLIYDELLLFNTQKQREAQLTSQVVVMINYLNEKFNTSEIRYVDGDIRNPEITTYLYSENKNTPIVYTYAEGVDSPIVRKYDEYLRILDFYIEVPSFLNNDASKAQISAIIQSYLFAGKKYDIRLIS